MALTQKSLQDLKSKKSKLMIFFESLFSYRFGRKNQVNKK